LETQTVPTGKDALALVDKQGLVTLFPVKGTRFPSLYAAVVGESKKERLEKTWNWSDNLAQRKRIHYGKLVARQVTLVSLEVFPYVFRLFHRKEKQSETAEKILGFLNRHGATSTTVLRKELKLTGKENKGPFAKALDELQLNLTIAIVSRDRSPQMTYSWDLIERWMPTELLQKAAEISESEAMEKIIEKLLENRVISKPEEAGKLLGWQH